MVETTFNLAPYLGALWAYLMPCKGFTSCSQIDCWNVAINFCYIQSGQKNINFCGKQPPKKKNSKNKIKAC